MNIIQLLTDYNIDYITEGKNVSPGWINMNCPFCDDPSEHLGYNLTENYFNCWRCGGHLIRQTVACLLGVSEKEASIILQHYGEFSTYIPHPEPSPKTVTKLVLPSNIEPLQTIHLKYLEKRGFDPGQLIHNWEILGSGPISFLEDRSENLRIDFKHRIIIPIIWEGRQVSFTSRDVTEKHLLRYISCPERMEIIHHKKILYGNQKTWGMTGICVEGPTDVWRMGLSSFATFGVKYTSQQLRLISKTFRRVPVLFDPDARNQADKLVAELRFRGVDSFRIDLPTDPGDMSQEEANYLVKQLIS